MSTTRLETFSDGVFAIAATLLVLEVAYPDQHGTVLHQLFSSTEVSEYAAYIVSFLIIGITWINHHSLFSQVARVDRRLTILNLFLLMMLAFTPFPTRVLAENLTKGGADAHGAAFFYSLSILMCGLLYAAVWWHASSNHGALLKTPMDDATVWQTRRQFGIGNLFYLATLGLSFISAPVTLGFHGAVAIYYAFDPLRRR
jgi:uncharacterized membrane protein